MDMAHLKTRLLAILFPLVLHTSQSVPQRPSNIIADTRKRTRQGAVNTINHPKPKFCFEDKCRCYSITADCSRNFGNLPFVPRLPNRTRRLLFSYNNLRSIRDSDFFINVSRITELDLEHNGLTFIGEGVFSVFRHLRALRLGSNALSFAGITPAFSARTLHYLYIRHMGLGPLPDDFFAGRSVPSLKVIDVSENRIQHLNLSVFVPLRRLENIWAMNCQINRVTSVYLPGLTEIHLESNALYDLPDSCDKNNASLFPSLEHVVLGQNKIGQLPASACLPKLTSLDLSRNVFKEFKTDMLKGKFPALVQLTWQNIPWQHGSALEKFAFRHPHLEAISFENCNIPFAYTAVDKDCFAGSPRLSFLQLSHNSLTDLSDEKFAQLFGSVSNLHTLALGDCKLVQISRHSFSKLRNLRKLHLFQNKLIAIEDGAFDSLKNLTELNLSKNQLRSVGEGVFGPETQTRLTHLDLSGNPFQCDCDLLWFQQWFVSRPRLFHHAHFNYTCSSASETVPLQTFSLPSQACRLDNQASKVIITCCLILLTLGVTVSALYRHRWYIRLLLAFHTRSLVRRDRPADDSFRYDIFVSFDSEDVEWVRQHLTPNLEDRLGLRLCVHERDFVPGKNILENIEDCVENSRRILTVFSRHFAKSQWCQFELNLCLRHAFEHSDALIVTLLGDVESRDLTSAMMAVLDTTTYIRWEEDVRARGGTGNGWSSLFSQSCVENLD